MSKIPAELKYTKEHEWVIVEGKIATIGITDHAQSELGDIVFVEMPELGKQLTQNGEFGVVESVKTVSNLYSPVSGKITAVNELLGGKPETINKDPYGQGWIIKVENINADELNKLLNAEEYKKFLGE
jgi:glycine cleavage system H protein